MPPKPGPTSMEDLAYCRDARFPYKVGPKVLADVFDRVDPDRVDLVRLDESADPGVQGPDDVWRLGVQVGHPFVEPAWRGVSISVSSGD
jgi:hypothetical protein